MSRRLLATTRPLSLQILPFYQTISPHAVRTISSTASRYEQASAPVASTSAEAHVSRTEKGKKGPATPSSCAAGTILSGLSLYKDRPDPVALPDEEYPEWLWTLLDDSSATSSVAGVTLESTAGLSKGEARIVQKRNMRAVRSAQRSQEKAAAAAATSSAAAPQASHQTGGAPAGAGMSAVGAPSEGEVAPPVGEAERLSGAAAVAVAGAETMSIEAEREAKKALRKANREKIKARNFVGRR